MRLMHRRALANLILRLCLLLLISGAATLVHAGGPADLEDLRKRADAAKPEDQATLFTDLARRENELADTLLNNGNGGEGMAYLEESVNDAIKAGAASVQSHHRQKETEIAIRKMISRMKETQHIVSYDDAQVMAQGINRLEKVRTELLASMFAKDKK